MFARNLDGARVWLCLHEEATAREYRELGLFVRDCIDRVERDLGRATSWMITIVPDRICFRCDVTARYDDVTMQATSAGFDGAVAGWQAFRDIEDQLRSRLGSELTCKVA